MPDQPSFQHDDHNPANKIGGSGDLDTRNEFRRARIGLTPLLAAIINIIVLFGFQIARNGSSDDIWMVALIYYAVQLPFAISFAVIAIRQVIANRRSGLDQYILAAIAALLNVIISLYTAPFAGVFLVMLFAVLTRH